MLIKKSLKNLMLIFLVIIYSCERDQPVFGENGMVVSTSSQASQVGIDIMKAGGNAIDAAAAVGFALAVTSSSDELHEINKIDSNKYLFMINYTQPLCHCFLFY